MVASKWRMRMAGLLLLCVLFLGNEVMCQDDDASTDAPDSPVSVATVAPDAAAADDSAATAGATAAPDGGDAPTGDSGAASPAPGDGSVVATIINMDVDAILQDAAGVTAGLGGVAVKDDSSPGKTVGGDAPADSSSSSSSPSVLVGILVTGLLAAIAITVGYFKCQRRPEKKGVRLAEEAFPADQENQGNTLASVAPLNPPPETPEKPSVNGESTEAAKNQTPPPTNGHSTAKAADTEL